MSAITIIGDHAPLAKIGEHSVHMFKAGVLLGSEETSLTRDHLLIGPTKEETHYPLLFVQTEPDNDGLTNPYKFHDRTFAMVCRDLGSEDSSAPLKLINLHDVMDNPQYQIVDLTSAAASVQDVCAGFKDDYAQMLHLAAQKRDEWSSAWAHVLAAPWAQAEEQEPVMEAAGDNDDGQSILARFTRHASGTHRRRRSKRSTRTTGRSSRTTGRTSTTASRPP